MNTVRKLLAAAANSVDGLTGYEYFVQATTPGAVNIRYDRTEYPNRFGGVVHWNVVLVLPQDQAAAERYIEEHVPDLRDAVAEHMTVTSIVPQRLQIEGLGILPTVFINGHREEE